MGDTMRKIMWGFREREGCFAVARGAWEHTWVPFKKGINQSQGKAALRPRKALQRFGAGQRQVGKALDSSSEKAQPIATRYNGAS